jgi:hypothetical protein
MKSITTCIFVNYWKKNQKHCIFKCIRKILLNTFENDDFLISNMNIKQCHIAITIKIFYEILIRNTSCIKNWFAITLYQLNSNKYPRKNLLGTSFSSNWEYFQLKSTLS